jgi:hypothetical protein
MDKEKLKENLVTSCVIKCPKQNIPVTFVKNVIVLADIISNRNM